MERHDKVPQGAPRESEAPGPQRLEDVFLTTYTARICAKSGDPGCLGTLSWHDGPCQWETVEMRRCLCGADELHGLSHAPECPLSQDATSGHNLGAGRNLEAGQPSRETGQPGQPGEEGEEGEEGALRYGDLPQRAIEVCRRRGWDTHWTERGAYLHLEASELIEAVRGKRGKPAEEAVAEEAADVLFVLMSITEAQGLPWNKVLEQLAYKIDHLMTAPPYEGEERGDPEAEA